MNSFLTASIMHKFKQGQYIKILNTLPSENNELQLQGSNFFYSGFVLKSSEVNSRGTLHQGV